MNKYASDRIRMAARTLRRGLVWTGLALFLVQVIFIITGVPQVVVDWLNMPELEPRDTPRCIVVLGGGGVPSGAFETGQRIIIGPRTGSTQGW